MREELIKNLQESLESIKVELEQGNALSDEQLITLLIKETITEGISKK